jgi:hypothetical protein
MSGLKDLTTADLSHLRVKAAQFKDDQLWTVLKAYIGRDREYIVKQFADPDVPAEKLKYSQGVLAQADRDILLVERFLDAIGKELQRRQHQAERT